MPNAGMIWWWRWIAMCCTGRDFIISVTVHHISRHSHYQKTVMVHTQMCDINKIQCFSSVGRCTQLAFLTTVHIWLLFALQRCAMLCVFNKQCCLKTIWAVTTLFLHVSVSNGTSTVLVLHIKVCSGHDNQALVTSTLVTWAILTLHIYS